MPDFNVGLRTKIDNTVARALDRRYAVVQKENLTLPLKFATDRVANEPLIVSDTTVSTGKRLSGGVSIVDMSFTPTSER